MPSASTPLAPSTSPSASPSATPAPTAATGAGNRASPALYIAWAEFQRRQVSMADSAGFRCCFLTLSYKGTSHAWRALHYARLIWCTLQLLRQHRPPVVWLQLPQMPLLWAALLYRALFDRRLQVVADCHNAVFKPPWSTLPGGLSMLPRCDLILVHNQDVLAQALALGLPAERTRVLEDVPPARQPDADAPASPAPPIFAGRPRPWVLFAGSYGRDEPVAEVLQAARLLGTGVVAVSGRVSNAGKNGHDISDPPANVVLTDYLPLAQFDALLTHCDLVLGLTRFDGIQLSVCNEALGFGRPLVVSDTPLLRTLFGSGAVLVNSADPADIVRGIGLAWQQPAAWRQAATRLAHERRKQWHDEQLAPCLQALQATAHPQQQSA